MTLLLDARQHAMLTEMGVRLWSPATGTSADTHADTAPPAKAGPMRPATVPLQAPNAPQGPSNGETLVAASELAGSAGVANDFASALPPQRARANEQEVGAARQPQSTRPGQRLGTSQALPQPSTIAGPASHPDLSLRPHTDSMDWQTLQQAVTGCQACGLCRTRKNTVFGVGQASVSPDLAPQVDWMVVGEAPGENEDLQGAPFVGAAGKLLDNMLKAMACSRQHNVFIANALKCRPPGNRNPTPQELVQCRPYLTRQISLLRPKIILAMGRFAVQTLLADSVPDVHTIPLGKLRGKVYAYQGVPVVVTYHPAYLLRSLPEKAKSWADMCLAMSTLPHFTSPTGRGKNHDPDHDAGAPR